MTVYDQPTFRLARSLGTQQTCKTCGSRICSSSSRPIYDIGSKSEGNITISADLHIIPAITYNSFQQLYTSRASNSYPTPPYQYKSIFPSLSSLESIQVHRPPSQRSTNRPLRIGAKKSITSQRQGTALGFLAIGRTNLFELSNGGWCCCSYGSVS